MALLKVIDMSIPSKQRILMDKIDKLRTRGVCFSQMFLNECKLCDLSRKPARDFSIRSTLSFVEKLLEVSLCYDIEVEDGVDVQALLDGKKIIFEIKSLYSFVADYYKLMSDWTRRFYGEVLNKNGLFAKVVFLPLPSPQRGLQPYVLDYRKVSTTHEASFGVLYFSLDALHQWTVPRTKGALREAYSQLKGAAAKYRIAVIDMRYEGINEFKAYQYILNILKRKRHEKLSGVILITFEIETCGNTAELKLILISNPFAENPISTSLLVKNPKQILSYGKQYLLEIPTRIHIRKPGLQDWIQMEPGYRIVHKGVEYGTL